MKHTRWTVLVPMLAENPGQKTLSVPSFDKPEPGGPSHLRSHLKGLPQIIEVGDDLEDEYIIDTVYVGRFKSTPQSFLKMVFRKAINAIMALCAARHEVKDCNKISKMIFGLR